MTRFQITVERACVNSHCSFLIPQDVDDFFEHERTFLLEYHNRVKDASAKSDRMTRSHKSKAPAVKLFFFFFQDLFVLLAIGDACL